MLERSIHDYKHTVEIPTRILDNGGGHLNHAVFFELFEQALNIFLDNHGFSPVDLEYGRLVRMAQTEYLSVVHGWPDPVTIGIGVRKLGSSSVDMEFAMFQHTEDARAVGHSIHVFVSRETGRPSPEALSPELRTVLQDMYDFSHTTPGSKL